MGVVVFTLGVRDILVINIGLYFLFSSSSKYCTAKMNVNYFFSQEVGKLVCNKQLMFKRFKM